MQPVPKPGPSRAERQASPDEFRDWFAALRRVHAGVGLAVIALATLALALVFEAGPVFQLALAATLLLLLSLPHAALDQYSAFIALEPRLGRFWTLGFFILYGGCALATLLLWVHLPGAAACLVVAVAALHYGLADLSDRGAMRALELIARGAAPFALALLFNPEPVASLTGWLILDPERAEAFIQDVALPAAMAWQGVWAIVVARQLRLAMTRAEWRPALVAAEMSMQVLVFASLPPLIAFVLFATLLHAPRHVFDFARRNPWLGSPGRALSRVLRATIVPTALAVAGLAAAGYYVLGGGASDAQLLRMGIWLATALAAPHALLTVLALRGFSGLAETPPPYEARRDSGDGAPISR